jgi:hypothetical protein
VADRLRAREADGHRRGEDRRAREESGELNRNPRCDPAGLSRSPPRPSRTAAAVGARAGHRTWENLQENRKSKLAWKVDVENAADEQETKKLEDLAKQRLSEAATKAGFKEDPDGWLTNTPFANQYKAANDVVANDPKLKGKVVVSFEYPTPDPPVLVGPGSECPRFVIGQGVQLTYGTPAAILVLPKRSLGRLALDMLLLQPDATTRPAGPGPLQSPVIEVARARDGNPELRTKLGRNAGSSCPTST